MTAGPGQRTIDELLVIFRLDQQMRDLIGSFGHMLDGKADAGDAEFLPSSGDNTYDGNLTITGDLLVEGTFFATESDLFFKFNWAWNNVSPRLLMTGPNGRRLVQAIFIVDVPSDGSSPNVSLGTEDQYDRFVSGEQIDFTSSVTSTATIGYVFPEDTGIWLTITPGGGASEGSGTVILQFSP